MKTSPAGTAPDFFEWPSGLCLQIKSTNLPPSLGRELGAFRRLSAERTACDAQILFCRRPHELPAEGETLQGRYKGIPWRIVRSSAADGKKSYAFYAPVFSTFLFVRTCLMPVLKKAMIERGGFLLIGSAFAFKDSAFILFGKPGSGKTRLLLDRLDAGAGFLGDSELMLTAKKQIFPVFPYAEARFRTLSGTPHWARLSLKNKLYLRFCHALSRVTLGRISFNLLLDSADNPWMTRASSAGPFSRYCVVQLKPDAAGTTALQPQDFVEAVRRYETGYQELFGEGIYTPELRERGLNQLESFLSDASLRQAASGQTALDLLCQEMKP